MRQTGVYKTYDSRAVKHIAKLLRTVMDAGKLSQQAAANEIGCDPNSIASWVRGQRPPGPEWAQSLATFVRVPTAEMLELLLRANHSMPEGVEIVPKATGFEGNKTEAPSDESPNRSAIKQSVQKAA